MRFLSQILMAVSFSLLAAGAGATPDNPQSGKDYRTLAKAQHTDAGARVEVIEFFWYSCPHCNSFEPTLSEWVKKQGDNIVFKRVPVAFRDSFEPQQRLYYALEAMGKSEELQKKIFRTIHVERRQLDTKDQIVDFIVKEGIDKQKFLDVYNSFSMGSKLKRAAQLQQDYGVDGVPMVAIGGRYVTSPSIVGASIGRAPEPVLFQGTLKVMDFLVAQSAKKDGAAAAKK